ncbi:3-isopropylmalate dehydratase small subunit [Buchananella felis]|uniref:3-isopropylmalate dehydratase small subunit n=1 Tax=Buchananella felis TaxID=3231492 RepID=UPI00352837DF
MEKFTVHTGIGVPLRRSNVDTDQIIPAVFLKRITRTGFDDALFAAWRKEPDFVLNQEPYRAGSVLVADTDFGTGSSREHAVWALRDYGFKAVLAPRFADIFRSNAGKQGLLVALIDEATRDALWAYMEASPGAEVTVDLVERQVRFGDQAAPIEVDDHTRERLLAGADDIAITLQNEADISAFEATRPSFKPKTLPARW